jgi:hypothetical protein
MATQLAKLKQISRLERESQIPEFCQGLIHHIFTVPATAAVARNILEYTLGSIMTQSPPEEEEEGGENMEEEPAHSPTPATAVYTSPGAPHSPTPATAVYSSPGPGAGAAASPIPQLRREPPSARKEHIINRRRLRLGNEEEDEGEAEGEDEGEDEEGEIDPEHAASVSAQIESQNPMYGVEQQLRAAPDRAAIMNLCLQRMSLLFDNDCKAKGTLDLGNLLQYTGRSEVCKDEIDYILQRVFGFPPQPVASDQAIELLTRYKAGVEAIMAQGVGRGGSRRSRRRRSRRSRRSTSRG